MIINWMTNTTAGYLGNAKVLVDGKGYKEVLMAKPGKNGFIVYQLTNGEELNIEGHVVVIFGEEV